MCFLHILLQMAAEGFFAYVTIGVDKTPLEAMSAYSLRGEQEKAFAQQKGAIGRDRFYGWSETARHGRMFVCFVGLILASYMKSVWEADETLRKAFDSTESVLAEMRTMRCIEHKGKMKLVTPFVGAQVDICKAFGFAIPEGCTPAYASQSVPATRKRGCQAKPKTEVPDF